MKETAEARELLQDVRDRHKEVLALEKDITMIKDMFFQLGYQVAQQVKFLLYQFNFANKFARIITSFYHNNKKH